jgi:hypothetical protein
MSGIHYTTTYACGAEMTNRRWAYLGMIAMIWIHLMTYIIAFSFMENPT